MKKALILGIGLGAILASGAFAQTKPVVKLCTGLDTGNYYRAGHIVRSKADGIDIQVIATDGSLTNLDKLTKGECDVAFVQSNSFNQFSARNAQALSTIERSASLYTEQVAMLCNRNAGVKRVPDLTAKHKIAVGSSGSGAWTVWQDFIKADPKRYSVVQTDNASGLRAVQKVGEGSEVQCALVVQALNAPFMKNEAQSEGDNVVLVGTNDGDMDGLKENGKQVYQYGEIPAGTYPKIQPGGTLWGTKPVKVIQVEAILATNTSFANSNEAVYNKFARAFQQAKPDIAKMVAPK